MATSLPDAAGSGTLDQVKDLVEKGANVEETKYGSKPLHWALQNGNAEEKSKIIRYLVDQKADLNAKNGSGMTPLQLASSTGDRASLELLLELGADRTLTVRNQTIEDLAKGDVKKFFEDEQKKVNATGLAIVSTKVKPRGEPLPYDLVRKIGKNLNVEFDRFTPQSTTRRSDQSAKKVAGKRKTRARKTKRRLTRRRK